MRRRSSNSAASELIAAAQKLGRAAAELRFAPPVAFVYNPLTYAWASHESYLLKFGSTPKRVVFLGMNPGPFGMVQTGVPFGEVNAVRGWLEIQAAILKPKVEHPRRPILGFECPRCEVSGERLWGLFARRFGTAALFFEEHFVVNYCPLAFLESSGRNRTPDKLAAGEREALYAICDEHLRRCVAALRPEWLIAVGDFAYKRAASVLENKGPQLGKILHPSPASPAANKDWAGVALAQLKALGVWR